MGYFKRTLKTKKFWKLTIEQIILDVMIGSFVMTPFLIIFKTIWCWQFWALGLFAVLLSPLTRQIEDWL